MIENFPSLGGGGEVLPEGVHGMAAGGMLRTIQAGGAVLSARDADPVELVNAGGSSPFVLTCEHAGRAIPASLGDLGVAAADMDRHIACDVGAEGLSRQMSAILDAPLVLQRYSRLVVDCNRPFEAADCFPEISDGTPIPANAGLGRHDRHQRFTEIHEPFHAAVSDLLDRRSSASCPTVLVSVHSFTPRLAAGEPRPWFVGALSNRDDGFARRFLAALASAHPEVPSAYNQPYAVDDASDYTIPVHGERRGLPHLLVEIRNDLIADPAGQLRWASLLAGVLDTAGANGETLDGR